MFLRLDEHLCADRHGERAEKGGFNAILEVQLLHNYWRGIEVLVCRISWLWNTYPAWTAASSDSESFLPTLALSGARYSRLRYSSRCGILFTTQITVKWDVLVYITRLWIIINKWCRGSSSITVRNTLRNDSAGLYAASQHYKLEGYGALASLIASQISD